MHAARNYMVHASHRDKAGVVEIHEYDTDIVYVLKGSATLITGGTPVGTKTIAPHEFRAPNVNGGETQQARAGRRGDYSERGAALVQRGGGAV